MTIQITHNLTSLQSLAGLDNALREALGSVVSGVNTGPSFIHVHLNDNATAENQTLAQTVTNAHGQLTVLTDKSIITADGSDTATITCNHAQIAGDANVDYTVWVKVPEKRYYEVYSEGTDTVSGGLVTLTLATSVAGTYQIEMRRQSVNWATGYVEVIAE